MKQLKKRNLQFKVGGAGDRIARVTPEVYVEATDLSTGSVKLVVTGGPFRVAEEILSASSTNEANLGVCMSCYELADQLRTIADRLDSVASVRGTKKEAPA